MANVLIAYALWLCFGLLGGHHYYLGRDARAFVWSITLGGFLIGWLDDFARIPGYVKFANADATYMSFCATRANRRHPDFTWFAFTLAYVVGDISAVVTFSLCKLYVCDVDDSHLMSVAIAVSSAAG